MAALCSRCGHILPCGFFFFSLPNLSHRRLDVCHTYTHGVALVQIWDAGLKGAARSLLKMRDAKYRQKFAICAPSYNFVGLYRSNLGTYRQSRKKLVKQQYLLQMSSQYGVLRPTSGWDRFSSLGHPSIFQWVLHLGSITARYSNSRRQPNCGVEQRAPPVFSRVAITLGIGPHSSFDCVLSV